MTPPRTLILAPLAIEARALAPLAKERAGIELVQTGPGVRCAEALRSRECDAVVLAGVAGGLVHRPSLIVRRVINAETGADFLAPGLSSGSTLVTVPRPLCTAHEKSAARETHGAELVDCEAAHVARTAAELGIPWRVVRVVSDGPEDVLPAQAARWVNEKGNTASGRVAASLIRNPMLMPELVRLGARTKRALAQLPALTAQTIDSLHREPAP